MEVCPLLHIVVELLQYVVDYCLDDNDNEICYILFLLLLFLAEALLERRILLQHLRIITTLRGGLHGI